MVAKVLINGEPCEQVAVWDRGFQYGDGLFETIAVVAETPLLWERHLARLAHGATRLGIAMPPESVWHKEAMWLCQGARRAVLKLVLTRGASGHGYAPDSSTAPTRVLWLQPWRGYPSYFARDGVKVRYCVTRLARNPRLAGLKHLNRLEQVLARAELPADCAEGLMCDEHGCVIEGTMTNLFAVRNGVLYTPDLSQCGVEGVVRAEVLSHAVGLGLRTACVALTRAELERSEEIFLTNSLIGLWPVRRLEEREYPVGQTTRTIQNTLRATGLVFDAT